MKENKVDLNIRRDILCVWFGRNNSVKDVNSPKTDLKIQLNFNKILSKNYFLEINKLNLKFILKDNRIAKQF